MYHLFKSNKMKNLFVKCSLGFLALLIFIIVITMFFCYKKIIFKYNKIFLLLGTIFYIIVLTIFYKKIIPNLIKIKYLHFLLFAIFAFFAIFFGIKLQVNPSWDIGMTFQTAKEFVNEHTWSNISYLARYPNNIMMVLFDIVILKLFNIFHINNYILGITIIVALIITSTIIIGFYCMKTMFNYKKATLYLFICVFTSPFYLYSAEYYTDTFSMIFPTLLLFFWLIISKNDNNYITIFLDILYGIILFVCFKLKITCTFVFIAIIFYELLQKHFKKLLKNLPMILFLFLLCTIIFNNFIENKFTSDNSKFPIEHWIMMGLNGNGGYSYEDVSYTNSFSTLKEKKVATRSKINERLASRDLLSHFDFIIGKLSYAWNDGTYYAPEVLRRQPVNRNIIHEFVLEDGIYNMYYKYIPQVMHLSMMLFILINIFRIFKTKDYFCYDTIPLITMLGIMLFLLIWENRSRYLVNLLPIIIMSQINGIDYVCNIKSKQSLSNKNPI